MRQHGFYRDVFIVLLILIVILVLCRITFGITAIFIMLAGCCCVFMRKLHWVSFCYLFFPLVTVMNRLVCGLNLVIALSARFGSLLLGFALFCSGMIGRAHQEKLPIKWMFVYVLVAAISSIDGWFPLISYLKLAQFFMFILGILLMSIMIQDSIICLHWVRCSMMAVAVLMIVGSICTLAVPSLGYSMMLGKIEEFGGDASVEGLIAREGALLFNGMTCHSQMLAPVVSILSTWVLCDMLLVERKLTILHLGVLGLSPALLYLSRSRGGLLTFVTVIGLTLFVCVPRARLSHRVKTKMLMTIGFFVICLLSLAGYLQAKNDFLSRWLRKTEDLNSDNRSLSEAFTNSRMALVEENLRDFRLNPLLGKGFQVQEWLKSAYGNGFITWYSAPVEKGVTPVVILGETGLLGSCIFLLFIISFYTTCLRRRYFALLNMFSCTLIANLADSTLFSPAGLGGFLWITSCVGGFGIDLLSIRIAQGEKLGLITMHQI